jgi:hypothetical protein
MRNLIQKLALVTLNYISMKLLLFHFDKYLLEMFLPKYYRRGLCKKNMHSQIIKDISLISL